MLVAIRLLYKNRMAIMVMLTSCNDSHIVVLCSIILGYYERYKKVFRHEWLYYRRRLS